MADIEKIVPKILKWEGGYQNMKEDKGNYLDGQLIGTNKGVTPAAYLAAIGKKPTVQDMKNLTEQQFMKVLKKFYWDRWQADKINNQSIANILVDWVWGSGKWGIIIPQRLLNLKDDGVVGEKTIAALNNTNSEVFFEKIVQARKDFLNGIVKNNPSQAKFIKGWLNRLNDFKYAK